MQAEPVPLLSFEDPDPVEFISGSAESRIMLVCEHGGRAVPATLASRVPPQEDMDRHIAYDVGAAQVARGLAAALGAPLAIQRYSRLVVDCNRQRHAEDLAPKVADGSTIPFNSELSDASLDERWQMIHQPFHNAVAEEIDQSQPQALIAIHSFTPQMRDGEPRPMELGFLVHQSRPLAEELRKQALAQEPQLRIDLDAPYFVNMEVDYTIPTHAVGRGLPHVLIEIRNDLIGDEAGVARWSDLLARAIGAALS